MMSRMPFTSVLLLRSLAVILILLRGFRGSAYAQENAKASVSEQNSVADADTTTTTTPPPEGLFVSVRNELVVDVELFWHDDSDHRIPSASVPAGTDVRLNTFVGHRFSYDFAGHRHTFTVRPDEPHVVLLGGATEIKVECTTTAGAESGYRLTLRVVPWWSPLGAARFLHLVRTGYYDGVALTRIVPNFLAQFGVARDFARRTEYRTLTLSDDVPVGVAFQPGMLSFAGSGPHSRTTEVFIVMPGAAPGQLDAFGTNPWETPFAVIDDVADTPVAQWYSGYGDMPPWGRGPDPQLVYKEDGYEYLDTNFSKLDRLQACRVVEIDPNGPVKEEM